MKFLEKITFIFLFLWQLPQNIVALTMIPFIGKLRLISCKQFCYAFEASNMSGGISLGNFAFLSPKMSKKLAEIAHEQEGHTCHSKMFGPLYLLIIGIPSILWAWYYKTHTDKCPNYYDFYTERWANKRANLEVLQTERGRYFLSFKNLYSKA